jgi:methyl-accepting chemotaxis protein
MSFSKLRLVHRLLLAFGAVGLLYLIVSVVDFYTIRQESQLVLAQNQTFNESVAADEFLLASQRLKNELFHLVLYGDSTKGQGAQGAFLEDRQLLEQSAKVSARYLGEDPQVFLQRLDKHLENFSNLLTQGKRDTARDLLMNTIEPMLDEVTAHFQEALQNFRQDVAHRTAESIRTAQQSTRFILLVAVAGFLLVVFITWVFARYMTRLLGGEPEEAVAFARKMAEGDLGRLQVRAGDEKSLISALERMAETFRRFVKAQGEIEHQHNEEGNIDLRMPVDEFPGVYGHMARRINKLVDGHIQATMKVVEVVQRYARGDLSVTIDRFPGKRAVLHEAVDQIRDRLLSIKNEIEAIAKEATRGNFARRGNTDQYENDFKEMVESLNQLMDISVNALNDAIRILNALANGDLTQSIESQYEGLLNQLKESANETVANLRGLIGQLITTSQGTANAATEIAAGNNDLSQRTEQQASSIEELSSATEELAATAKQNADRSKSADQIAKEAENFATEGGEAVKKVVDMMQAINESAKRISEIIYFMDNIAFQTNILALNASVEASRAGEHGRGFAVLAIEIRNLAQRSANSAREIKGLIGDSLEKVGHGVELADETGKIIEGIVESIQKVSHAVGDITLATNEQSQSIDEVNQAILQMDRITQQNASLVEELATAAAHLKTLANDMAETVTFFKLEKGIQQTTKSNDSKAVVKTAAKASKAIGNDENNAKVDPEWEEF